MKVLLICTSRCPQVFYKVVVLKNFAKLTGKHQPQRLFNEVVERRLQAYYFIKKETPAQVEIYKILKNTFLLEQLWTTVSGYDYVHIIPYSSSQRHELYIEQGFCSHLQQIFEHIFYIGQQLRCWVLLKGCSYGGELARLDGLARLAHSAQQAAVSGSSTSSKRRQTAHSGFRIDFFYSILARY